MRWPRRRSGSGSPPEGSFRPFPFPNSPVAFLAVWLKSDLKREAVEGAFDRRHAARRELRARVLWQNKKAPGKGLGALGRSADFRFETDLGSDLCHFPVGSRKKVRSYDSLVWAQPRRKAQVEAMRDMITVRWGKVAP